jgi:hypothetical protein
MKDHRKMRTTTHRQSKDHENDQTDDQRHRGHDRKGMCFGVVVVETACLDKGVDMLSQLVSPPDQMMIERTRHDVRRPICDVFDDASIAGEMKLKVPKERGETRGNSDMIRGQVT